LRLISLAPQLCLATEFTPGGGIYGAGQAPLLAEDSRKNLDVKRFDIKIVTR
jgi:hypothetical protein